MNLMESIPNILLSVKPNKVITVVVEAILEHALTIGLFHLNNFFCLHTSISTVAWVAFTNN